MKHTFEQLNAIIATIAASEYGKKKMNNCFDVYVNNRCLGRGVNKAMANAIISNNSTLSSVVYKHATLKVVPMYQLNS